MRAADGVGVEVKGFGEGWYLSGEAERAGAIILAGKWVPRMHQISVSQNVCSTSSHAVLPQLSDVSNSTHLYLFE